MRGKALVELSGGLDLGITPAYAGKRDTRSRARRSPADHPRICGEKEPCARVRYVAPGITPAYAGKSRRGARRCSRSRDHPRICGEKIECVAWRAQAEGSPPHMRGKDTARQGRRRGRGITPAYAGKRALAGEGDAPAQDHPRICGEKTKKIP